MAIPAWKAFQDRVAEMEPVLVRAGLGIESPGWLIDKETGQRREVDVLVRVPYAPKPLLIMMECRKWKHRQDVRWIEGLAAKRDSVGADRVVAVSQSPFSAPAKEKARLRGVELRTLAEVDAESLLGDAYSLVFWFERRLYENVEFKIDCGALLDHPGVPVPPLPVELGELIKTQDIQARAFVDARTQQAVSVLDVWKETKWEPAFRGLQPGMAPQRRIIDIEIPGSPPAIHTQTDPPVYLWGLRVTADFSVERVHLRPCTSLEYSDETGALLRRLEWDLAPAGHNATVVFDIYPPNPDGAMPFVPRVRQIGTQEPTFRLRYGAAFDGEPDGATRE